MNILILIISALLAAAGQFFLKKATVSTDLSYNNLFKYFIDLILNKFIWFAVLSYFISFAMYMIALKKVELSIARSLSSLSYLFIIFFSFFFLRENISLIKIIGISLIGAGIFLLSFNLK